MCEVWSQCAVKSLRSWFTPFVTLCVCVCVCVRTCFELLRTFCGTLQASVGGVSPSHCGPCYVSSALTAGDTTSTHRGARDQHADTAGAAVTQLSALVTRQLQKAAMSGCDSVVMPTATPSAKQVTLELDKHSSIRCYLSYSSDYRQWLK